MKIRYWRMLVMSFITIVFCNASHAEAPAHLVLVEDMKPRLGKRVQVNANDPISKEQCVELIELHRSKGLPDGQISVHAPSLKFGGHVTAHCVENYEGDGIQIHEYLY